MALVASGTSVRIRSSSVNSNPTASLVAALHDFENILSDKQKLTFRSNYGKPGPNDVLALASRIDAENKTRGGKCFAPRLCTFLDRVVQFTGIVDTFVQSNPLIAALVWGGAKTAILAACNHVAYFEKITGMLMKISQTCPVYRQFAELYPGSVELQAALSDYYAAIIRLCIRIVEISQRSVLSQTFGPIFSPFEVEFNKLLDELTQAGKDVDIRISFASQKAAEEESQLAELERKANALHRHSMSKFRSDWKTGTAELQLARERRRIAKMRLEIQENLCSIDHLKAWRQAKQQHLTGTADWFLTEETFTNWSKDVKTSLLWCSGRLGTGKTVFASNVVAKVLDMNSNTSDLVSYYFCRSDDSRSLISRNIFGSICRQLLSSLIDKLELDALEALLGRTRDLDTMNVIELMLEKLTTHTPCWIILDGLDECGSAELADVSRALAKLCQHMSNKFRIMCCSRPELEVSLFKQFQPQHHLSLSGSAVDEDIGFYVRSLLDRCLEDETLVISDPDLILDVATGLQSGAKGMFLWARLVFEELCHCISDYEVRQTLANLPKELSQIYSRKIVSISKDSSQAILSRTLETCCFARRALTLEELREAVSVEIGQDSLAKEKMPNNMHGLILGCRGLLYIDEQDCSVHFIHHSVRQFLVTSNDGCQPLFEESSMDITFGHRCLTYLSFSDFERQLTVRNREGFDFDPVAVSKCLVISDRSKTARLAQSLLKLKVSGGVTRSGVKSHTTTRLAFPTVQDPDRKSQTSYAFLAYARANWIFHLQDLKVWESGASLWHLFVKFIRMQEQKQAQQLSEHFLHLSEDSLYTFALKHDHAALIRYQRSEVSKTSKVRGQHSRAKLLVQASSTAKYRVLATLARRDIISDLVTTSRNFGHGKFLDEILNCSGDRLEYLENLGGRSILFQEALYDAVLSDRLDIVTQLLNVENSEGLYLDTQLLLRYSVENGYTDLAAVLFIRYDILSTVQFDDHLSPLQVAAIRCQTDVVIQLRVMGVRDCCFFPLTFSAAAAAAWNGDLESVKALSSPNRTVAVLLLTFEALYSPLQAAVKNEQFNIIDFLLDDGRVDDYRPMIPWYPLFEAACQNGSIETVYKLLSLMQKTLYPDPQKMSPHLVFEIYELINEARRTNELFLNAKLSDREWVSFLTILGGLSVAMLNCDLSNFEERSGGRYKEALGSVLRLDVRSRLYVKLIQLAACLRHEEILKCMLRDAPEFVPADVELEERIKELFEPYDFGAYIHRTRGDEARLQALCGTGNKYSGDLTLAETRDELRSRGIC